MSQHSSSKRSRNALGLIFGTFTGICLITPACTSGQGALVTESEGGTHTQGGHAAGGGTSKGGASSGGRGGAGGRLGTDGGAAGIGNGAGENGGHGGGVGAGDATDWPGSACTYQSDPVVDAASGGVSGDGDLDGAGGVGGQSGSGISGAGGSGGAAPVYDITLQKNAFVGSYLADADGKALYVYAADFPGDCETLPVSNCTDAACPLAWPIFNAGDRALAPGLEDGLFGTIERPDGSHQTTYRGWPLYYYKNDLLAGDVKGHAVGRVWHLAESRLPNIVLLRIGTERLLGDGNGRALYVFDRDSIGDATQGPISACTGACRSAIVPFTLPYLSPVSYLEPSDFSLFLRPDGGTQVAYKGAPLYQAKADTRSGVTNGTAQAGVRVAPP